MRCPICKKETVHGDNPYRPFCSERCKMIDLDNWLSGRYRIPGGVHVEDRGIMLPEDGSGEADEKADLD